MASFALNTKARFNYELLEELEAGIELLGLETKAVRSGKMSLEGAHVTVRGGEAYLVGATVSPYQPGNTPKDYNPTRNRKLLMTRKEIAHCEKYEGTKGLTIVPISVYNKGRRIKVNVAIARGKKKFDKRETLKRREADKDMARSLKTKR